MTRKPTDGRLDEIAELALARGGRVMGVNVPKGAKDGPPSYDGEMYDNTIVVPNWKPPTLNSTMRGTIRDRIRHGKSCRRVIAQAARGVAKATGARRVTVTITFPSRRSLPDPDSIGKALLDSLTHAGMLIDDRYEYCEMMPPVYRIGDRLETEIALEDIPTKTLASPKKPRPKRRRKAS